MNMMTSLLFYLLLGGAVAVADFLAAGEGGVGGQRMFRLFTAFVFWPLYLPALLQGQQEKRTDAASGGEGNRSPKSVVPPVDDLAAAIRQVESELDLALASLDGWSDAILAREQHRFEELRAAWHAQADKIRELDLLLKTMATDHAQSHAAMEPPSERVAASYRGRQANIDRLAALRDRCRDDLMNTLAWVRELVTMIHLAKYTGAPASRADELVMQIATSIEGISEVAGWRNAESAAAEAEQAVQCSVTARN